jgi:ribosomal protein S18 acetylase RimI-like enzyme
MRIRSVAAKDRPVLHSILFRTQAFTAEEISVALELIDITLKDTLQKDYYINCLVNDQDQCIGYICYGPAPMTRGTFDLYWIAVDPDFQKQGVGLKLIDFLERVIVRLKGRMILVETSTIPHYEKTKSFYLRAGFQEVERIPDYYRPGNDRVTFCKRLIEKR